MDECVNVAKESKEVLFGRRCKYILRSLQLGEQSAEKHSSYIRKICRKYIEFWW